MIGECDLCVLVRPMICEKVHKKKKKRFHSVTNYLIFYEDRSFKI